MYVYVCRDVQFQKQLWEISIHAVQEHLSPDALQKYSGVTEEDEELNKSRQEGEKEKEEEEDEGERQQPPPREPQQAEESTQDGERDVVIAE